MPPPNPHKSTATTTKAKLPCFSQRRTLFLLFLLTSLLLLLQNFHRAFLALSTSPRSHPRSGIGRIGVGEDLAANRIMGLAPPVVNRDEARNGKYYSISYLGVDVADLEGGVGDLDLGLRVGIGDEDGDGVGVVEEFRSRSRSHVYDAFDDDEDDDDDENADGDLDDVDTFIQISRRENEFMPLENLVLGSGNISDIDANVEDEDYEAEFDSGTDENEMDDENETDDENESEESSGSYHTPSDFYQTLKRRVIQTPKGRKWGGWYEYRQHNNNIGRGNASKKEYEIVGDVDHWWRNSRSCFEVDHLCHFKQRADWENVRNRNVEEIEEYMAGLHKWFYYDGRISKQESDDEGARSLLFQPSMTLKFQPNKYDKGTHAETRVSISVKSPSSLTLDGGDAGASSVEYETIFHPSNFNVMGTDSFSFAHIADDQHKNTICRIFSTPTHIVVQNVFNDMIGEFYTRTLVSLYRLMSKTVDAEAETKLDGGAAIGKRSVLPWEQDIQFYVHLAYSHKKMLDAHKLLLSGMLTSPESKDAISLLELFLEKDEDDFKKKNKNESECQCYEKMVFCGYDVYVQDGDIDSSDGGDDDEVKSSRGTEDDDNLESSSVDDDKAESDDDIGGGDGHEDEDDDDEDGDEVEDGQEESRVEQPGDHFVDKKANSIDKQVLSENKFDSAIPPVENVKYTLWSGSAINAGPENRECALPTKFGQCQDFGRLREFLLSNIIRHYPFIQNELVSHRTQVLLDKGFIDENYRGDTKEWKIVGLTQRTYRRTWVNLSEAIEACDELHNVSHHKVACIEVNVEKTNSPIEQLLLHGKLDGLIGVHGAQMTQAILLPRHAHVLELLPWIPNYARGAWVQRRSSPTPLGIIFHNTDLNHLGYSLGRDSVPLCEDVEETKEQECFFNRKNGNKAKFVWESRDFNVKPEPIVKYIENVVLQPGSNENAAWCEEIKARLEKKFVWYNIWCLDDGSVDGGNLRQSLPSAKHFYENEKRNDRQKKKTTKRRRRGRQKNTLKGDDS